VRSNKQPELCAVVGCGGGLVACALANFQVQIMLATLILLLYEKTLIKMKKRAARFLSV